MNDSLYAYILNMKAMARSFEDACYTAATKDKLIDQNEQKALRRISRATDKYVKALEAAQKPISSETQTTATEEEPFRPGQKTSNTDTYPTS